MGRVLVDQARLVLASAARFEGVAASTRAGVEPELTIAIDPLVPTGPLINSLRALSETFPNLPVHFSTEGLGGSLRRLRDGSAAFALCLLLPGVPEDIAAYPLLRVSMRAVVSPGHPLALLGRPATEGAILSTLSKFADAMRYQSDCRGLAYDDSCRHLLDSIKEERMTHEFQRQMLVHAALQQMRFDRVARCVGSGSQLERRRLGGRRALL